MLKKRKFLPLKIACWLNDKKITLTIFSITLALFLLGCNSRFVSVTNDIDKYQQIYNQAIVDAAIAKEYEEYSLTPIKDTKIKVAQWLSQNSADKYYKTPYENNQLMPVKKKGGIFVSLKSELQKKCQNYLGKDLTQRLEQLLGLPLNSGYTYFVEMSVRQEDIFRPCIDPDITKKKCEAKSSSLDQISQTHKAWLAEQMLKSYQFTDAKGYPFTRLGYTYDWNPDTPDLGVSEYIIREGAKIKVINIMSTQDYCRSAN